MFTWGQTVLSPRAIEPLVPFCVRSAGMKHCVFIVCVGSVGPCPGQNGFYATVCLAWCVSSEYLDICNAGLHLPSCPGRCIVGGGLRLEAQIYGSLTETWLSHRESVKREEKPAYLMAADVPLFFTICVSFFAPLCFLPLISQSLSLFCFLFSWPLPTCQNSYWHHEPRLSLTETVPCAGLVDAWGRGGDTEPLKNSPLGK